MEGASGGGSFFTGDPGKYVKMGSRYGHLFPFAAKENLESEGGAHIPGTLKDE